MITGIIAPLPSSRTTSTTLLTGSLSAQVAAAAMPAARPGTTPSPGSGANSTPAAAPRNSAGKIGPPRRLPRQSAYAAPLHSRTAMSAPMPQACGSEARLFITAWPDEATSTGELPVTSAYSAPKAPAATAQTAVWATGRLATYTEA